METTEESCAKGTLDERKLLKDKRNKIKRNRLRARYIKRAMIFLDSYERLECNLRKEILSLHADEILSICYIFGTSLVSPKEVYCMQLPEGNDCYILRNVIDCGDTILGSILVFLKFEFPPPPTLQLCRKFHIVYLLSRIYKDVERNGK